MIILKRKLKVFCQSNQIIEPNNLIVSRNINIQPIEASSILNRTLILDRAPILDRNRKFIMFAAVVGGLFISTSIFKRNVYKMK